MPYLADTNILMTQLSTPNGAIWSPRSESPAQVHDARLVAVMRVHGLTHVLTFNPTDFTRYPGITVVRPQDVPLVP
jgi:hypothetical protein